MPSLRIEGKFAFLTHFRLEWWREYSDKQTKLRHPHRQVRIPRRRASDGMIKVNMNVLFEERLLDLDAITDNKVRLLR